MLSLADYKACMEATARLNRPAPVRRKRVQPFYFIGPYLIPERARTRDPMVAEIQAKVAGYFQIPLLEMRSARRAREVVRPRQVAMYLAKRLTARSLPQIGIQFGGRDHTTVIHAVRQIEMLRGIDDDLNHDILTLEAELA